MSGRRFFRTLHLVSGLGAGLIAAAVGISGGILSFREEIERLLYEPKLEAREARASLDDVMAQAAAVEPSRRISLIALPEREGAPIELVLQVRGARTLKEADQWSLYADPHTGEIVGQRRREGSFIAWLRDLHFALFSGTAGLKLNGWIALALVFVSLTGLVLWLQTLRSAGLIKVHWSASWKRVLWDLHRATGVLMLVFLLIVSLTGAYYAFRDSFLKALQAAAGSLPPRGTPKVEPVSGAVALAPGAILLRARAALSDARVVVLRPPAAPTQAWAVTYHRKGDEGESVDSGPTAYLDPYTGAALRIDDPPRMAGAARLLKAIEPLHFGKFGGTPVKVLWFLLGLSPALLFGSGVVMWWNRTRSGRRAASERRPPAGGVLPAGS